MLDADEFERNWNEDLRHSGAEHRVYRLRDRVLKANNLSYHRDWNDFLERLILHENLFPDTRLQLEGFIEGAEGLEAILSQRFEPAQRGATAAEVLAEMTRRGFTRIAPTKTGVCNDNDYENALLRVEDLHDENVLVRPDGSLAVIDPVIYLQPGITLEAALTALAPGA